MLNYLLDELSVSIESVQNSDKTYKWLNDNSIRIGLDVKEIIDEFYKKYITSSDKMYRYVVSPIQNEALKNIRMRMILIKVDNDFVLVPLKIVSPIGKLWFFSLSMEPISYNGVWSHVIDVLKVLKEFDCIKYIVVNETKEKDAVDNNYYNLIEDFKNMDRSVWRSKRGVNKLIPIIDFNNNAELIPEIDDKVFNVNAIWNNTKSIKDLSENNDKKLVKLAIKTPYMSIYSFSYHGKMVGYSIAEVILDKYAALISTKQITNNYEALKNYIGEDTDELKMIHKHISSFMQYMIHKDIFNVKGLEGVYNYGDMKLQGLKKFKLDYYNNVIYYNRYSLDDYIRSNS